MSADLKLKQINSTSLNQSTQSVPSKKFNEQNLPYSPSSNPNIPDASTKKNQEQFQGKTIYGNPFRMLANRQSSNQWAIRILVSSSDQKKSSDQKVETNGQKQGHEDAITNNSSIPRNKRLEGILKIDEKYQNVVQYLKDRKFFGVDDKENSLIIKDSQSSQRHIKLFQAKTEVGDWKNDLVTELYVLREKLQKLRNQNKSKSKNEELTFKSLILNEVSQQLNEFQGSITHIMNQEIIKLRQSFQKELYEAIQTTKNMYDQKLDQQINRTKQWLEQKLTSNMQSKGLSVIQKQESSDYSTTQQQKNFLENELQTNLLREEQNKIDHQEKKEQENMNTQDIQQPQAVTQIEQKEKNIQEIVSAEQAQVRVQKCEQKESVEKQQEICKSEQANSVAQNIHFNPAFYRGAFRFLNWQNSGTQSDNPNIDSIDPSKLLAKIESNEIATPKYDPTHPYDKTSLTSSQVRLEIQRVNEQIQSIKNKEKSKGNRLWNCYNKYEGAYKNPPQLKNQNKSKSLDYDLLMKKYEDLQKRAEEAEREAEKTQKMEVSGSGGQDNVAKQLRLKSILELLEFFEPNYNASVKMLSRLL